MKNPKLRQIIDKYELFQKKNEEYEQCILTLLLLNEYEKGENSFWWPYLDILPTFDTFNWELDEDVLKIAES